MKVGRRLSARLVGFLPKTKTASEKDNAKVAEVPPKIEEPAPVAPLENPAAEKDAKPVETAPVVAVSA
jgi:hypothetical protein